MERHEVVATLQEAVDFYSLPVAEREYGEDETTVSEWIEVLNSAIDYLVVDAHDDSKNVVEDDRGKNMIFDGPFKAA